MRLVIEYVVSDGCTYGFDQVVPVEYESAEAFAVEFEEACKAAKAHKYEWQFEFAGRQWNYDNFFEKDVYYAPEVMTVDEWFERPHL